MEFSTKQLYLLLEIVIVMLVQLLFITIAGIINGDWLTPKEYIGHTIISLGEFLILSLYMIYVGNWVTRFWFAIEDE